jgi:hypothetical protein
MTTTACTHKAEAVTIYLGGGMRAVRYRIVDNLDAFVDWADTLEEASRLVTQLSEPKPDE